MENIEKEKEYLLNKWKIKNRRNESIERYDWEKANKNNKK